MKIVVISRRRRRGAWRHVACASSTCAALGSGEGRRRQPEAPATRGADHFAAPPAELPAALAARRARPNGDRRLGRRRRRKRSARAVIIMPPAAYAPAETWRVSTACRPAARRFDRRVGRQASVNFAVFAGEKNRRRRAHRPASAPPADLMWRDIMHDIGVIINHESEAARRVIAVFVGAACASYHPLVMVISDALAGWRGIKLSQLKLHPDDVGDQARHEACRRACAKLRRKSK